MRVKNPNIQIKSFLIFYALIFFLAVNFVYSQNPPPAPPPANPPRTIVPKPYSKSVKRIENTTGIPAEKSIAVDSKVNVSLCISEGRVKVNGWERSEIRVFVNNGSEAGFKIQQKNQNGTPVWVMVLGFDPVKNKEVGADECLSGDEIELDVPRGASVNIKSNGESRTNVNSVRRATVEIVGGDIMLSNIEQGITATTYEGDVRVEKSSGAMSLVATTGNIVVFDVSPSEIGDTFKAKTNSGAIILQQTGHRQIEASSNSGSIKFSGDLLSGGLYNFSAFNGSINLSLKPDSSCKVFASYNFGAFDSEIPLDNIVKSAPKGQNLSAQIGKGEATLNLSTYSGTIQIKKQQ